MSPKKNTKDNTEAEGSSKKGAAKKTKKKKADFPSSKKRKTGRVILNGQARNIIAKVYEFMKREATENHAERLTNARWRTAAAVGVSQKTVSRILKEKSWPATTAAAASTADAAALSLAGKSQALNTIGNAINKATTGDVGGALQGVSDAVGNVVRTDLASNALLASGATNAAGNFAASALNALGRVSENTAKRFDDIAVAKQNLGQGLGYSAASALSGNFPGALLGAGGALTQNAAQDVAATQGMFL